MKSIVFSLTINGNTETAVLRTNADIESTKNFTIMGVDKPSGLTENEFPFKAGTVWNYQDVLDTAAVLGAKNILTIAAVYLEDSDNKSTITLPVVKKVSVTVTNEGATLTINDVVQSGLSWVGYLHKGESVTYTAELEGYTTQTKTLTVNTSDITESVTLESV